MTKDTARYVLVFLRSSLSAEVRRTRILVAKYDSKDAQRNEITRVGLITSNDNVAIWFAIDM